MAFARLEVCLTPIGIVFITVCITRIAGPEFTTAAGTRSCSIREATSLAATSTVANTGIQIHFTTVAGLPITISKARFAYKTARTTFTRGRGIARHRTGVGTRPAMGGMIR